ncbi:G-protein coupled receptor 83-like [Saccoglossus kowalevskii]|uniref:Probable G-protein coupled receptor 83-like n=1 Tax=Saccoglossus kowalevskii TaxID=10224 RepID=A0ABM0MWP1_SACKO|nr:PREDICTED: probable G-protein coupled receptor 83-like [Saccoglossus kowalevskii]
MENTSNSVGLSSDTMEAVSLMSVVNILIGVIGIIGLLGNSLVCVVVLRVPQLRTLANYLIVHQAIIDVIASIVITVRFFGPQTTQLPDNLFGEMACRLWKSDYLIWSLFLLSSLNLVLITMERYYAIVYPLSYQFIYSPGKVKIMVVVVWIVAFVFKIYNPIVQSFDHGVCITNFPSPAVSKLAGIATVIVQYITPLIVMAMAYTRCIFAIKHTVHNGPLTNKEKSVMRARNNILKMLVLVFLVYAVCWGPNQINNVHAVSEWCEDRIL